MISTCCICGAEMAAIRVIQPFVRILGLVQWSYKLRYYADPCRHPVDAVVGKWLFEHRVA